MLRTVKQVRGLRLIVYASATVIFAALYTLSAARAQTVEVDASLLKQLQQIIEQQQEQLGKQASTIDSLTNRVDQLEGTSRETQAIATQAKTAADQAISTMPEASAGRESSRAVAMDNDSKIKLAISGHINRAMNVADDGDKTRAYFVDNDVSDSRIRFIGTGQITEDWTLGSVMEIAFSPNNSSDVSQDNESADDFVDVRKVEGFGRNDKYGQLRFGKGQAAADDTAEFDLSLVAGPIMYSGVADIVGALQFTDGDDVTGIRVDDAFFNFDGDRQDRVRYDTPVWGPLQLSASAGDDQRYDVALGWGYDYGDWTGYDIGSVTTLGAVSIRDPSEDDVDFRLAGSFSTLHNPTGLSLTVAGGMDSRDDQDDPYSLYGKLAWDTEFFKLGATGFGVDFSWNENISAADDEGMSFGVGAIQLLEDYGTEIYAQFRLFDLDPDSGPADDIIVGTLGTRVKF